MPPRPPTAAKLVRPSGRPLPKKSFLKPSLADASLPPAPPPTTNPDPKPAAGPPSGRTVVRRIQSTDPVGHLKSLHLPPRLPTSFLRSTPPTAPPVSPYANPTHFTTHASRHPKLPKTTTPLPALSAKLHLNPFAHLLATSVRSDAYSQRRLPAAFLVRFVIKRHPETDTPHLLPDAVDKDKGPTQIAGGYTGGTHAAVAAVGSYKKNSMMLIPVLDRAEFAGRTVWREDMADFVLKRMRRRVVEEVECRPWSTELDFGEPRERRRKGKPTGIVRWKGEECEVELVPVGVVRWRGEERAVEVVDGRTLPVFEMRGLLGEGEELEKVLDAWGIRRERQREVIWMSTRTRKVLEAMMRLRGYLEMGYVDVPVEGETVKGYQETVDEGWRPAEKREVVTSRSIARKRRREAGKGKTEAAPKKEKPKQKQA